MHNNTLALWRSAYSAVSGKRVLEVGPDRDLALKTTADAAGYSATEWDTIDIAAWHPHVKIVAKSEEDLGLPSDGYDVVVSANVMEHVRRPWRWVPELARVLKPGGALILLAPSNWPYHPEGWFPDCYRFWDTGMRVLLEDAGLTVERAEHGAVAAEGSWAPIDVIGIGRRT